MKLIDNIYGHFSYDASAADMAGRKKRIFYDTLLMIGFLCCLPVGAFPSLSAPLSLIIVGCAAVSFFDENLYLYSALFTFMRYKMLIGDETAFRVYSLIIIAKFVLDLPKTKFRVINLPAIFVFAMHSLFVVARHDTLRMALFVFFDVVVIYIVLLKVLENTNLFRKFLFVFLLGGVASGFYGWFNNEVSVDINIRGAGNHTVNRNFGALGDSNFAGLFYNLCIMISLLLKKVPVIVKGGFVVIFTVLILQTASLSAILTFVILGTIIIVLKFRRKSVPILIFGFFAAAIGLVILLSVPAFRKIDAIAGLIIRITEKLSYIPRGRWDLLTTDRSALWGEAMQIFFDKSIIGQCFGGSLVTVMVTDIDISNTAIHNSYIQSVLNFGILGTLFMYIPFFVTLIYRMARHFSKEQGYEEEDVRIIQLIFMFAFAIFGFTVDFFIDWTYLIFYFI